MKKLIHVLLAVACFGCAESKSDDNPFVLRKVEFKPPNRQEFRSIKYSFSRRDDVEKKEVAWLRISMGGIHGELAVYLEWSGGHPVIAIQVKESERLPFPLLPLGKEIEGFGEWTYMIRPPRIKQSSFRWVISNARRDDDGRLMWYGKFPLFIGLHIVQDAKEND